MAEQQRRRRRTSEVTQAKGRTQITTVRVKSRNILSEETSESEFDAEVFQSDPAFIRVSHGVTKSIGDYESLRVDVAITMPCYREQVTEMAEEVGEAVAVMLETELDAYGVSLHGDNG